MNQMIDIILQSNHHVNWVYTGTVCTANTTELSLFLCVTILHDSNLDQVSSECDLSIMLRFKMGPIKGGRQPWSNLGMRRLQQKLSANPLLLFPLHIFSSLHLSLIASSCASHFARRGGSDLPIRDLGHPALLLLRRGQHRLLWQQRARRLFQPSAIASSMRSQLSRASWMPVLDVGQGLPHGTVLPQAFARQCVPRINQLCLRI